MVTSLHILAIKWVGFPGCGLVTGKRIPYTFFTVTWQVLVPVRCLRRFVENNAFCIIHTSWTEKKKCANQYSPCCILSTAVFFPASPRWFIENNADRNLRCWLHNSFMVCSWKNSVRDVTVKRKLMFCTYPVVNIYEGKKSPFCKDANLSESHGDMIECPFQFL